MTSIPIADLSELVRYVRSDLDIKKYVIIYAHNGTGKTRLSMAFKEFGKSEGKRDTLYFNAFTEDLFYWDNDLEGDSNRILRFNSDSRFFSVFKELEREQRIFDFLENYADIQFKIDYNSSSIVFYRNDDHKDGLHDNESAEKGIKISRGEENIFIWCLFLVIVEAAVDKTESLKDIKFLCIDDPISSLDENNAIAVASQLAQMLKRSDNQLKTLITSHHTLFFNVLCNELGSAKKYSLNKGVELGSYTLASTKDTPTFYHISVLVDLYKAAQSNMLYTYHFGMLRAVMERTASFHGFDRFDACLKKQNDDTDSVLHARLINILSHGNYSIFDPVEMIEENKRYFKLMLSDLMSLYRFNPELFPAIVPITPVERLEQ